MTPDRSWRLRGYAAAASKTPDVDRVCGSDAELDLAMKELEAAGYERIPVVPL